MSAIELLMESLKYKFIHNALIAGTLIAVSCSVLGVFLVLKKQSMIGDGLAHVSFGTIAVALLLGASPLLVSIPVVVIASFLINALNKKAEIHGDAAIGLLSSVSIAIGVMISSLAKGLNMDLNSYLFGSILSISDTDVLISAVLSLAVAGVIMLFYGSLFSVTFDEEFAKVKGLNINFLNSLISVLTSVTIVLGIRVVGTLLISSLIIFPAVSALQISSSFKGTILLSSVISVVSVVLGIFLSFIYDLPTGTAIVILNALFFVILFISRKIRSR